MTTKRPETVQSESCAAIPTHAEDWNRQFIKHFELHLADAGRELTPNASESDLRLAAVRACLATFLDSGMDTDSVRELLGQAAVEASSALDSWSDALNERRFVLIDKEIQGTITAAENVELARLTRIMRDNVESEMNLPTEGARALHRKLLQLDPTGGSD